MAKYEYDVGLEVFKRLDNRGNYLSVNISEAQRIISLVDLGYSNARIMSKVPLENPKATMSTMNSFIKNYKLGNIIMPENAPAPSRNFEEIVMDNNLNDLIERVARLEVDVKELKDIVNNNPSLMDRIRSRL